MWKLKSGHITNLVHLVEPTLVRRQLRHEGLMFQPFAVEVPGLIVRRVLSRQHLLIDPQSQLEDGEDEQVGSGIKTKQDLILYLLKTQL